MSTTKRVGVIVGSLRKESFSRKVAKELIRLAPASLAAENIEIGDLTIFNQDLDDENRTPQAWTAFREKMKDFDAVLFVTPEYNRSVPPVLKNAIDVGSRPYGKSVWNAKPGAVVSVSPGRLSGFGANHHLRQSLVFLNVPTMQQPEGYIGEVDKAIDANGNFDERTTTFLESFMKEFALWVATNSVK